MNQISLPRSCFRQLDPEAQFSPFRKLNYAAFLRRCVRGILAFVYARNCWQTFFPCRVLYLRCTCTTKSKNRFEISLAFEESFPFPLAKITLPTFPSHLPNFDLAHGQHSLRTNSLAYYISSKRAPNRRSTSSSENRVQLVSIPGQSRIERKQLTRDKPQRAPTARRRAFSYRISRSIASQEKVIFIQTCTMLGYCKGKWSRDCWRLG